MKLDKKQKILFTLVIIALAYLAWQVYSMFFAGPSQSTVTPAPTSSLSVAPKTPTTKTQTAQPNMSNAVSATVKPAGTITTPQIQPVATQPGLQPLQQVSLLPPMSAYQSEYLRLVNRYQLLKMRRMIVEEEAAIASSQAKIAQFNQQAGTTTTPSAFPSATTITGTATPSTAGYQLMYIDYQDGRWSAILNHNNRFKEVYVGTVLSDGTRIMKIDSNGVITRRKGLQYLISFYGTTPLPKSQYVRMEVEPMPVPVPTPIPAKMMPTKPIQHKFQHHRAVKHRQLSQSDNYSSNNANTTLPNSSVTTSNNYAATTVITPTQTNSAAIKQLSLEPETTTSSISPSNAVTPPINPNPQTLSTTPKTTELDLTPQQKTTVSRLENSLLTKTPANAIAYSSDEKHLLSLPKTHYTLQILGSYKLSDLNDLVKTNHLQDAFIFHTYYLNKDWYVLISGDFATEDEATNALKALPPAVQSLKPWVRSMSSVQDAIKLTPQNG